MNLTSILSICLFLTVTLIDGTPHHNYPQANHEELIRDLVRKHQKKLLENPIQHPSVLDKEEIVKTGPNRTACTEVYFRNSNKTIPRTIITSFPGSGNTWMRHLIHMATGFHTGRVYNDNKLVAQGFKGETLAWNDNRTVGVKMHQFGSASKLAHKHQVTAGVLFPKTLLLIRNPFRAILSEFNRLNNRGHSHTGEADEKLFHDGIFLEFFGKQLPRWGRSIAKWMNEYQGEVQAVCYERMKEETIEVVKKSVEFMEVPFARPRCIKKSKLSHGNFKRVSKHVDITEMIKDNPKLKKMADLVLQGVRNMLKRKDLEDCTEYFE